MHTKAKEAKHTGQGHLLFLLLSTFSLSISAAD